MPGGVHNAIDLGRRTEAPREGGTARNEVGAPIFGRFQDCAQADLALSTEFRFLSPINKTRSVRSRKASTFARS